jgi:aminoglycoside phosphotransferase family enzyme
MPVAKRHWNEGWVRDVHGDLHAEHICFAPEGIQIFDCIEFNTRLRRSRVAIKGPHPWQRTRRRNF